MRPCGRCGRNMRRAATVVPSASAEYRAALVAEVPRRFPRIAAFDSDTEPGPLRPLPLSPWPANSQG